MADKTISSLTAATAINSNDLLVLEQSGTAKKATGQLFERWLLSMADGHGGISNIAKTSSSGTNPVVDTYTITYADGSASTFTITNGVKGDRGDTGAPATLQSTVNEYQQSANGTTIPTGTWLPTIPAVPQGAFLWTRTTLTFNSGAPAVIYTVSRSGLDGAGSVSSVNGISPDSDGNVQLPPRETGSLNGSGDLNDCTEIDKYYSIVNATGVLNCPAPINNSVLYVYGQNDSILTQVYYGSLKSRIFVRTWCSWEGANGTWRPWQEIPNFSNLCNPNLLDNWYFGNPVNQRGQSVYTGTGYGIDRWTSRSSSITVTVNAADVSVASSASLGTGNQMWTQPLENGEKLAGKTLTASVLIDSCNGSFALYFGSSGTTSKRVTSAEFSAPGLYTVSGICPDGITDFHAGIIKRSTGDISFSIAAAKLEIGSNQTLAHQDGGAWVLNEIPDYSTELLKCQRYFFSLFSYADYAVPLAVGVCTNTTTARVIVNTPVPMRDTPTLTNGLTGSTRIRFNGGSYEISALNAMAARGNTIYVSATCTGLTAGEVCALVGVGAAGARQRIDFSAEL